MDLYVKCLLLPYFLFFLGFKHDFFLMHWFYPYRIFKHSKWNVTN